MTHFSCLRQNASDDKKYVERVPVRLEPPSLALLNQCTSRQSYNWNCQSISATQLLIPILLYAADPNPNLRYRGECL